MRCLFFLLFAWASALVSLEVLTEAKVSYFIPTDSKFRAIYGQDGIQGGLEASFHGWDRVYPWLSVSLYENSGHLKNGDRSHIYLLPLGAGLKYIYSFQYLSIYGGAGFVPAYLKISHPEESKWGYGGIGKFGFLSNRFRNLFIDLFGEYSYIHVSSQSANPSNLSNFTIGGGVGYWFGGSKREYEDD